MISQSIGQEQHDKLVSLLEHVSQECALDAVAVCDTGGTIMASHASLWADSLGNAAALAAAAFAATRELASLIGEHAFDSIMLRGEARGLMTKALGPAHIIVIFLGKQSVEGMVRLVLRKVSPQMESILTLSEATPFTGADEIEIKRVTS
jgi:predicted regulator of Ras-like GTPase activity (Roadblock/LC7/MglB family)